MTGYGLDKQDSASHKGHQNYVLTLCFVMLDLAISVKFIQAKIASKNYATVYNTIGVGGTLVEC
jgi:hypothetical protein